MSEEKITYLNPKVFAFFCQKELDIRWYNK